MPLFKTKEGEPEDKKTILPTIDKAKLKGCLKCLTWVKKKIKKKGAIFPVCMILVNAIYLSIGGAIFVGLEAQPKIVVNTSRELVELFDILKNTDALPFQMNGTEVVKNMTSEDIKKFEETLAKISNDRSAAAKPEWNIYNAIFFCMTVTTTIGYGSIAPVTVAGRVFCIVYALMGIPLTLALLAVVGKILGDYINDACAFLLKWFRRVHPKYEYERTGSTAEEGHVDAPFWLALLLLFGFTACMAGLYCWIEGWDFGTSLYFQYITFLTIGFGDVVPQKEEKLVFLHMFLILTGLSVLSITLSMIATNLAHQMQKASFINKLKEEEELSDMSSSAGSAVGIGDEEGGIGDRDNKAGNKASFANDDTNGGKNYGSTKGSP